MSQGGEANAERVADICADAHRVMAAGRKALAHELDPCTCKYPNGDPRYTRGGRMSHRCGR